MASLSDTRFGHYGTAGILIAAGAVLALIVHLAVPYAHVNPREADIKSEVMDRGEVADLHKDLNMASGSSPGMTLTGTIMMAIAGIALLFLTFTPLPVNTARWAAWSLSGIAIVGGLLALASSMMWVGSGFGQAPLGLYSQGAESGQSFTPNFGSFAFDNAGAVDATIALGGVTGGVSGLLEMVLNTDNAATVFVISPILVALASGLVLVAALALCGNVITQKDGVRERASAHLAAGRWAVLLLALVLLLPWSIGKAEDYSGDGDTDPFVFGAHTVLNVNEVSDGKLFGGLGYALMAMVAAGWIGTLAGVVGSLGGILVSVNAPAAAARSTHYAVFAASFMTIYVAIVYLLAWIYMWKPYGDVNDYQPGYFPGLLLPVLAFWVFSQIEIIRNFQERRALNNPQAKATVTFD